MGIPKRSRRGSTIAQPSEIFKFHNKKCGSGASRDEFLVWCFWRRLGSTVTTKCNDIIGYPVEITVTDYFYKGSVAPQELIYEFKIFVLSRLI